MKKGFIILFTAIILLIFILLFTEYKKYGIKEVTADNISEVIKKHDYVLIRYGKPSKSFKTMAKNFKKEYRVNTYYTYLTKSKIEETLSIILDDLESRFNVGSFDYIESSDKRIPGIKFKKLV